MAKSNAFGARRIDKNMSMHCYKRAKERANLTKNQAKSFAKNASMYGNDWKIYEKDCPNFFNFLKKKQFALNKRIKVYKNYIFILNSDKKSKNFTTLYPIPDEFKEEIAQFEQKQREIEQNKPLRATFTLFAPYFKYNIEVKNLNLKKDFLKCIANNVYYKNGSYILAENGDIIRNGVKCGKWNVG